ncbi:MAG TPA: ABC transporter permease, partial [Chloroflexota bacterium]|nr:ABC transporter permease [Chloroflexota bacterium]
MLVTDRARGAAQGQMLRVQLVSGECFTTLRQSPQVGRLLTPADNRTLDGHPVAVISDGYWNRAFGRAPDIVSHDLAVNGTTVTVVGVASTGFFGTSIDQTTDIWLPSMMQHSLRYRGNVSDHNADVSQPWSPQRGVFWLTLFLRIPDASTRAAIESRIDAIAQQHFSALTTGAPRGGAFGGVHATLQPGDRGISRLRTVMQNPLVVLLTMVSLLLLIACANIAGLLLARSTARQRELAVRIAIGASARRLLRQLLAESLLLSLVGGALGVLAARWGTDALLALFSSSTSNTAVDTSLDLRVLAFAFLLSILTGLAFGLLPAARSARLSPADALAAASRGMVAGTSAPGRIPLGRLLVGAQLAVTVLLLSVAALFGRTLQQLANVDLGYARGQILLVGIDPVAAGYTPGRLPALYDSFAARLGALPGVISTSLSADGPLSGSRRLSALTVEGYDPGPDEEVHVQENTVTPAYFKTLGIELVAGRTFGSQDVAGGRLVAVVNETMARRYFRHGAVLGKRIAYDADLGGGFEIIGVVRDARYNDLRGATPDLVYRP